MRVGPSSRMPPVPLRPAADELLRDRLLVHPNSAELVVNLLRQPAPDLTELTSVVRSDPSLAAAVLRAANAVHLGHARRIGGVRHAIVMLGDSFVASLA